MSSPVRRARAERSRGRRAPDECSTQRLVGRRRRRQRRRTPLTRLETKLHPGGNLSGRGGRPRHFVGLRGYVADHRITCIPAARYDSGPVIVPEYGTGAVTRIRSDTLGFCAASSALTASAVKLYEMVFTAPAAILTVPLSALA